MGRRTAIDSTLKDKERHLMLDAKQEPQDVLNLRPKLTITGGLKPRMVILAVVFILGVVVLAFMAGVRSSQRADTQGNTNLHSTPPPASVQDLPKTYSDIEPPESPAPGTLEAPEELPEEPTLDPALFQGMLEEAEAARTSPILFALNQNADTPQPVQTDTGPLPPQQERKAAGFVSALNGIEPYLDTHYRRPRSAFEIKAGTVIPAALVTAVNSDLPGDVVARVTEHVFDSVTGRHVLVPAGAVLYGAYNDAIIENGHNRVMLVWQRIIMPDGRSVQLQSMAGIDPQGQAGVSDTVDHHYDQIAGGVVLSTLLAFGGNLARSPDTGRDHADVIGDTVAQEASRVGQRAVERQLSVRPTIKIRQGMPVSVLVNQDITLEPYRLLP